MCMEGSKPEACLAPPVRMPSGGRSCKTCDFYFDSVPLKNQSRTLPPWPARNLKGKQ